jgi:hypothetical protein
MAGGKVEDLVQALAGLQLSERIGKQLGGKL